MAALTWSFSRVVPAPADVVYAWMIDFQPDDHGRDAFLRGTGAAPPDKPAHRKVTPRGHDAFHLDDAWGRHRYKLDVTLERARREVHIRGQMGYQATWRAVPAGESTRVVVEGRLPSRWPVSWLMPLFAKGMLREMQQDFDGHMADLEETLRAG